MAQLNNTVLFAGAGLSAAVGLPATSELTEQFLTLQPTRATPEPLQGAISACLAQFWERVFGYRENGQAKPSFEDHFTALDLAANTGHALGTAYSPRQLRAIRRLSIHRVFDTLESRLRERPELSSYLEALAQGRGNAVVTTNWDIAIERHLAESRFNYSIPMTQGRALMDPSGLKVIKLHGSSNWAYCDCCERLFAYEARYGKGALYEHIFIESADLSALGTPVQVDESRRAKCRFCGVPLSSRVATFSYAKLPNFVQFLTLGENAFRALRDASHWVFVGYSLPDADFQIRHMLKSAQLGRPDSARLRITVVTKDENGSQTSVRFHRFFGDAVGCVIAGGFDEWVSRVLQDELST